LKGGGGVSKSKEHHLRFEQASAGGECGLPFISSFDANVVVTPSDVKLSENMSLMKTIDNVRGERKGVVIFDSKIVELPIVLY